MSDDEIREQTAEALEAVGEVFDDYVIFPSEEARTAAILWVAHAHVFYAFESTPRLSISSTGPGSGKSRVLEVIEHLVPSPLNAVQMTPGVMWRAIEHTAPTIMLDEVDTIFGKNGSSSAHRHLRGILNAGHRKGAVVPRTVGADDIKYFRVFAPVAMAGLGALPETIATRSVSIVMQKRKGDQEVRPFRLKYAQDALKRAKGMLEEWAMDAVDVLEFSCPEMPVFDRQADVWEPLISIAEMASRVDSASDDSARVDSDWYSLAIRACKELTAGSTGEPLSPGLRLLHDVREVFADAPVMFTRDVLAAIQELPDNPWGTLDPRKLGRILAEYDVRPTTVRNGDDCAKGYRAEDLAVAWTKFNVPNPQPVQAAEEFASA